MEKQLLSDPEIYPDAEVLKKALGDSYLAYNELEETFKDEKFNLRMEWRYYKDGRSWLAKVSYKKKTVLWLSVWDAYFKVGFYFTEKTSSGIFNLDIEDGIKKAFDQSKNIGKLIPLVVDVSKKEQIKDVLKIIEYKKSLK
ncbi:MAG: DUF3788 family protein [Bacteroidales bacterium]|nr:DUF3788 family protein [Bacteroidales bacterium]